MRRRSGREGRLVDEAPARTCLYCRRSAAKHRLVRLTVIHGAVQVDADQRRSGRGAYLCRRPACLDGALRRGGAAITRALRAPHDRVTVDADTLRAQWPAAVGSHGHHTGASERNGHATGSGGAAPRSGEGNDGQRRQEGTTASAVRKAPRLAPSGRHHGPRRRE